RPRPRAGRVPVQARLYAGRDSPGARPGAEVARMISPATVEQLREAARELRHHPRAVEEPALLRALPLHSGWQLDVLFDARTFLGEFRLRNPEGRTVGSIRFEGPDLPGLFDAVAALAETVLARPKRA